MPHILIIEDEPSISDLIEMNLRFAGHACDQAFDGRQALSMLAGGAYDLAILDLMLPEIDGLELLPTLRERRLPTIIVSAKAKLSDRVQGLSLGADDYLVKPFEPLELVARAEALLRRAAPERDELRIHGLTIKPSQQRVYRGTDEIPLTHREFALLMALCRRPGAVFTREQLLAQVWGTDYLGESRTVDVHIQRLRRKLDWADAITTAYRSGYRLEPEVSG